MPRAKNNVARKHRVKRILKQAKGFFGRKKTYSVAKQNVIRAGMYAYAHRRKKKGDFRRLWTVRISAGLESLGGDLVYSRFIHLLSRHDIQLNRKVLAYLALHQPEVFSSIVEEVKKTN